MRLRFFISAISLLLSGVCFAQSDMPAADSSSLDFKQWGLLAIQDGGRRKPIDTFARETLIKTTGRSSYTDARGKKWQANDFVLSMLLDTHDWKSEPMILVSLGQLIEKLGLDKTKRRFSFTELTSLPELNRLAGEAHALKKAEKPLDRLQSEAMSVSERLTIFAHVMDGRSFLLVPAAEKTTDPWVVPPDFARYYDVTKFMPLQTQLQTLATRLHEGRRIPVQPGGESIARRIARVEPEDLSGGIRTAPGIFLQPFRWILSRGLVLRDRVGLARGGLQSERDREF